MQDNTSMRSLALLVAAAAGGSAAGSSAMKEIVEKLREMQKKAKEEGDAERKVYAKFKCYCDTTREEKEAAIKEAKVNITEAETEVDKLRALNGQYGIEKAQMTREKGAAEDAKDADVTLRATHQKQFETDKSYMEASITQLEEVVAVLGAMEPAALVVHDTKTTFMKPKANLLAAKSQLKKVVQDVQTLSAGDRSKVLAFLSGSAGGASTGEIKKILDNLLETFKDNLKELVSMNTVATETHDDFVAGKDKTITLLSDSISDREDDMGDNAGTIESDLTVISTLKTQIEDDETFLEDLNTQCSDKAEEYEKRNQLRVEEAVAISKAIAILNSDEAFDTFGANEKKQDKVTFVQVSDVVDKASSKTQAMLRAEVAQDLHALARKSKDLRIARIALGVKKNEAIQKVIGKLEEAKKAIDKEQKEDDHKKGFCEEEQKQNEDDRDARQEEIEDLEERKGLLEGDIEALDGVIETTNEDIHSFKEAMATEKDNRKKDYREYNIEVKELKTANKLLTKAIKVLKKFYERNAEEEASVLVSTKAHIKAKEDPAPPETFGDADSFEGQAEKGNSVIGLLEGIKADNNVELEEETKEEEIAQADFEAFMTDTQADIQRAKEQVADAESLRADKRKHLAQTEGDLKNVEQQKKDIEKYLESIHPGCQFMHDNYKLRQDARVEEKKQLDVAIDKLENAPANQ